MPNLQGPAAFVEAWDTLFDEVVTPGLNEQTAERRALAAPQGDADVLVALYDDVDRAFEEYNTTLDNAVAGDLNAIESISSGSAEGVFNDVNERARDYGLTVCGDEDE